MAAPEPSDKNVDLHEEDDMLDAAEAAEEIEAEEDHPMDGEDEDNEADEGMETEIDLTNDSAAYFDAHTDSLFAVAAHPIDPSIIATGSGDDSTYVFSTAEVTIPDGPVLPASYESNPTPKTPRDSIKPIAHLTGHTDSISALTFALPDGAFFVTAGLDGKIRVHDTHKDYKLLGEAQEVEEIAWLSPCPHPQHPNTFAFGANDGSVWVYTIEPESNAPLSIVQTYYQHAAPSTAGAWSPSGTLLASVAEDSSLYVYDPFGEAAAAGVKSTSGQAVVALTGEDQRFAVEGGLYSVAIAPSGAFLATGGASGIIRIVGLPLLPSTSDATKGQKSGPGSRQKGGGAKQASGPPGAVTGQPGAILASLQAQTDGVETLAFAPAPLTLLAAGSVDGSVALFDCARRFAVRRLIRDAHGEDAVVQVSWSATTATATPGLSGTGNASAAAAATSDAPWLLTSAGMDGVLRRWDARGGTAAAGMGLMKEWRGHRGGGEGGGVMGFVEGGGKIVSAGDDGIALVFDAR
jgi:ribosome assembly protein SQT1